MGLLGPGMNVLTALIDKMSASLNVGNTFGPSESLRTETSLKAAVAEILKSFKKSLANEHFKLLLMKVLQMSTVLQHTAYQMLEWTSAVQDLSAFVEAIPATSSQAAISSLRACKNEQASRKAKRQLFEVYLASALYNRKPETAAPSSAASAVVNFADAFGVQA